MKIFQDFDKYSFKYKETIAVLYGEILEKESGMLSAQPRAKTWRHLKVIPVWIVKS